MTRHIKFAIALVFFSLPIVGFAQQQPKLVVGITVDQMRWDFLNRFNHRWHKDGGMRRLLDKGFNCNAAYINYLPSYTACGHAGIYTGSVPAFHGITGNTWWDNVSQAYMYCTSDTNVTTVGGKSEAGRQSPNNLLGTTICDELRIATAYEGKTIGIALKDRGGILAAGHSANAAYWYDSESGEWITSTYYMNSLPKWVTDFKSPAKVDSLYRQGWSALFPIDSYQYGTEGPKPYQVHTFGGPQGQLPYNLAGFAGKRYDAVLSTPHGNTLTTQFAMDAVMHESLGADNIADFLAISYSSIDYIGHAYGPNSVEMEDAMARLDIDLGHFFRFLDKQVGQGEYLVFLTADHGSSHIPGYMTEHKLPSGIVSEEILLNELNTALRQKFGEANIAKAIMNSQVILDIPLIQRAKKLGESEVTDFVIEWLNMQPMVNRAIRLENIGRSTLNDVLATQIANAYFPKRSGHVQIIYKPALIDGFTKGGTTHGTGYAYDTHIPLLFYGWKIPVGNTTRKITINDIAPTVASLLHIQEPSTSIGHIIGEITDVPKH